MRSNFLSLLNPPDINELSRTLKKFLACKFPQLVVSRSDMEATDFAFKIYHPAYDTKLWLIQDKELEDGKKCIEFIKTYDSGDVIHGDIFYINWVEYEVLSFLHRIYKGSHKEKYFCVWHDNKMSSYGYYMEFYLSSCSAWYDQPKTMYNIVRDEVLFRLENTALDMMYLFGWNHHSLDILHPQEGQ